jgi:hypothetical protein
MHPPPLVLMDHLGPALAALACIALLPLLREPLRLSLNWFLAGAPSPRARFARGGRAVSGAEA